MDSLFVSCQAYPSGQVLRWAGGDVLEKRTFTAAAGIVNFVRQRLGRESQFHHYSWTVMTPKADYQFSSSPSEEMTSLQLERLGKHCSQPEDWSGTKPEQYLKPACRGFPVLIFPSVRPTIRPLHFKKPCYINPIGGLPGKLTVTAKPAPGCPATPWRNCLEGHSYVPPRPSPMCNACRAENGRRRIGCFPPRFSTPSRQKPQ